MISRHDQEVRLQQFNNYMRQVEYQRMLYVLSQPPGIVERMYCAAAFWGVVLAIILFIVFGIQHLLGN